MALYKNIASQKIAVYAHDTDADAPKTGDAANITAQISKDFGAAAATNDTNPTELDATDHPGIYVFDLTQAETDADVLVISAVSSTSDIALDPVQIFTTDLMTHGILDVGTAQSVGDTSIVLRSDAAFIDDGLIGCTVVITNGTQVGSRAVITDYVSSTDTATLAGGWTGATPSGTPTYQIYATAAGAALSDIAAAVLTAAESTPIEANVKAVNDAALTGDGDGTPWGPA